MKEIVVICGLLSDGHYVEQVVESLKSQFEVICEERIAPDIQELVPPTCPSIVEPILVMVATLPYSDQGLPYLVPPTVHTVERRRSFPGTVKVRHP